MSGKTWTGKGDWHRKRLTSQEEHDLRCDYMEGKLKITEAEMKRRIAKIRKKTGKP